MASDPSSLPAPHAAAEAEGGMPEEIAKAIEDLVTAAEDMGASYDAKDFPAPERESVANEYKAALTAAILSRLASAERCCDSYARENQQLSDKADVALARVDRLESVLQQMLKPFPCVSGPPEDALEDWMAARSLAKSIKDGAAVAAEDLRGEP